MYAGKNRSETKVGDFKSINWNSLNQNTHKNEVPNSRVTKSSHETELQKMTSDFELLTRKFL